MKRFICYALCLLFCINVPLTESVYADESCDISSLLPTPPEIVAETGVVMELSTGTVLYNKNMHNQMYPASITKIMTTLLALETCEPDEIITFSHYDVYSLEYGDAHIGMRENEQISVHDCLRGVMLASANECANATGEHIATQTDSYKKLIAEYDAQGIDYDASITALDVFADIMNERAKKAGALNTHFTNPSGLFNENHYTTCYDMARITRAAVSIPEFLEIESKTTYTIPPTNLITEPRTIGNRHKMLYEDNPNYYEGVLGGKTGYVDQSGNTLVTFAKRGDITLISVVMKTNAANVYNDTRLILDYGFANCKSLNISNTDNTYNIENSLYSLNDTANLIIPASISFSDVKSSLRPSVTSPEINYEYNGLKLGSTNLSINVDNFSTFELGPTAISHLEKKSKENKSVFAVIIKIIMIVLVIIIVLIAAFFIIMRKLEFNRRRRRRRRRPKHRT